MNMYKYIYVLYVLLISFSLKSVLLSERGLLPLPSALGGKQVYYIYTPYSSQFSCGYYTLASAFFLEKALGKQVMPQAIERLKKISRHHTRRRKMVAEGTCFEFRQGLADMLDLYPFVLLYEQDIAYQLNGRSLIKLSENTKKRMGAPVFAQLKKAFNKRNIPVLHFAPELWTPVIRLTDTPVWHVVLMSVVNEQDGSKSLYIFDCCNYSFEQCPTLLTYAQALIDTFNI